MPIRIPESHKEPLKRLATMPPADRKIMLEAIRDAQASIDPADLMSHVENATGLESTTVRPIMRVLLSLYRLSVEDEKGLLGDVANEAKKLVEEPERDNVDWGAFATDLAAMIGCDDSLGVTAKISMLRTDHQRLFCSSRILTDIRPVFGDDPTKPPRAAAIVHSLRLTCHVGDTHEDIFVALDAEDLRLLRNHCDRAMKKELSLKEQVRRTEMRLLEVEDSP